MYHLIRYNWLMTSSDAANMDFKFLIDIKNNYSSIDYNGKR